MRRSRRGFAVAIAILLLGMVGLSLLALSAYFTQDATRTRTEPVDAQLRQLLIAGAIDVKHRAGRWEQAPAAQGWAVELPADLSAEGSAHVCIDAPDEQGAIPATIEAAYAGRHMSQDLKLTRKDNHWEITRATLGS